jgi:hypothetical protein
VATDGLSYIMKTIYMVQLLVGGQENTPNADWRDYQGLGRMDEVEARAYYKQIFEGGEDTVRLICRRTQELVLT